MLLDSLGDHRPSAWEAGAEMATDANGEPVEIDCTDEAPLAAYIFKTVASGNASRSNETTRLGSQRVSPVTAPLSLVTAPMSPAVMNLQDCVKHGVLAGYPMVGLKAVLLDGSYHPVDSSEMAFKMAASLAYKAGMPQASPALLEPSLRFFASSMTAASRFAGSSSYRSNLKVNQKAACGGCRSAGACICRGAMGKVCAV